MPSEPIQIEIFGKIIAKKNMYLPIKGRFIKNSKLVKTLARLSNQIPKKHRGIGLVHPKLDLFLTVKDGRSDRDNMLTTVVDLLKSSGVIVNDSIAQFNGRVTIHPAKIHDHYRALIILTPAQ